MRSATDDDDSKSDDDTVFESTTDLRQSFVAALQKKREKGNPKQYVVNVQSLLFFPLFFVVCVSLSLPFFLFSNGGGRTPAPALYAFESRKESGRRRTFFCVFDAKGERPP